MKLIINSNGVSNVERFWELFWSFDSLKEDQDKYPDTIFAFKDDMLLWDFNKKTGVLWIKWSAFWSVFEVEFALDYDDIQEFIKVVVEEHFKSKDITPIAHVSPYPIVVEEHFKSKDITPIAKRYLLSTRVEEHFKSKDITPTWCGDNQRRVVEEHFKSKDITPRGWMWKRGRMVEEHFKSKDITPQ